MACSSFSRFAIKGRTCWFGPISARYMHKEEIDAFEKENPEL